MSVQEQFKKTRILEHRNIANFSTYKNSAVSVDQPIFEPTPSVIQFTNYEPLQVKEVVLKLRWVVFLFVCFCFEFECADGF